MGLGNTTRPSPARAELASERFVPIPQVLQYQLPLSSNLHPQPAHASPAPYRAATPAKSIPRKPAPRAVEPCTIAAPAVDVDAAEAEEAVLVPVVVEEVLDREEVVDDEVEVAEDERDEEGEEGEPEAVALVAEPRLADDVMVFVAVEEPAELAPVAAAVVLLAVPAAAVLLNSSQIEVAADWACNRSAGSVQLESRHDTARLPMAGCDAQAQAWSDAGVQTAEMAVRRQGVYPAKWSARWLTCQACLGRVVRSGGSHRFERERGSNESRESENLQHKEARLRGSARQRGRRRRGGRRPSFWLGSVAFGGRSEYRRAFSFSPGRLFDKIVVTMRNGLLELGEDIE